MNAHRPERPSRDTAVPAVPLGGRRRRRALRSLASVAALALAAAAAAAPLVAHEYAGGELVVDHPYAPATPPGVATAAGYLDIVNGGDEDDRLLGGEASFAERVEVHRTVVVDDVARMRELEDGLTIPAGEAVELAPGGTHLMFVGLDGALLEGGRHAVTLRFERAGEIEVTFAVERLTSDTTGMIDHRERHGDPESSEGH